MEFLLKWLKNAIVLYASLILMFFVISLLTTPNGEDLFKNIDFLENAIFALVFSFIVSIDAVKKFLEKPLFQSNKK